MDRNLSGHVRAVNNFIITEELNILWNYYDVDYTYSNQNRHSTLDHFLMSRNLIPNIHEAGVVHHIDSGGHSPIYAKIAINKARVFEEKVEKKPVLSWDRSSEEQKLLYKNQLYEKISSLPACGFPACAGVQAITESAWEHLESRAGTS